MTAREIAETVWNERERRPGFREFSFLGAETQDILTKVAERALKHRKGRGA